ncbi:MAG TPA: response regulator transcription factor [Candidatus Paenibacillus intestinavium]|nr:response regulator transcription factor [Candidatus Paenibacillus intestinavium]
MSKETILIVDDEKEIIKLVEIYFQNEDFQLLKATNGLEALDILSKTSVDLIILDVMMPHMDGIETCMKIREERNMPIIMLSAKGQDIDKITGLSIGADDYVTKPFSPLELIARVKSQLRRYKRFNLPQKLNEYELVIDDLVINSSTYEVTRDGQKIKLTPREFAILELLARNQGHVLSMEQIYQSVWNETFMESNNTVMVHVRKIREKTEVDPRNPKYVQTVWGIGYRIEK